MSNDNISNVNIPRSEYNKMLEHAVQNKPSEACGLLGGYTDTENGRMVITKVYLLTNTDQSSKHFSIDPREHLAAVKDMRAAGLVPIGNWHSHPNTPARPSEEDIRLAYNKNAIYMILSLSDNEPVLNAFCIDGQNVTKAALTITEV